MMIYNIVDVLTESWERGETLFFDRFYNPYTVDELLKGENLPIIDQMNMKDFNSSIEAITSYMDRANDLLNMKDPVVYNPLCKLFKK